MDKASGVYYYQIDNSIRPVGTNAFGAVVPMFTVKGPVGKLATVTVQDYKDILGYDLVYNPRYLGLDYMLQSVARLEVLRLNHGACVGNYIWTSTAGVVSGGSESDIFVASSIPVIDFGDGTDIELWVSHKTPGDWGEFGVWFTKEMIDQPDPDDPDGDPISVPVFTLFYGKKLNGAQYEVLESKPFSFDENETNFWGNLNFSDISFGFKAGAVDLPSGVAGTKVVLAEGTNGVDPDALTTDQLTDKFAALNSSAATIIVGNGFSVSSGLCSKLVDAGASRLMSVFIDVPDLTSPDGDDAPGSDMTFTENDEVLKAKHCIKWATGLVRSEFCQPVAVPDIVGSSAGDIFVWPSVNLFLIYARMFQNYGHTRYPPAGSYGSISVSKLIESDFHLYGDEIKTARISYQKVGSKGPVMWEDRTTYALDSDLSYASTVFILRDLRSRLISYMDNFTFRFTTAMDLLNIESGLTTILSSFKQDMFLVNFTLKVPSYAEAQAAGRNLDIPISVSVISDAQVITLLVTLENAATLGA
jgi:hypothetical protein